MKILVLNCGSSSIKYKLYDMDNESVLAQGGVERIGLDEAFIKVKLDNGDKRTIMADLPTHKEGVALVFKCLLDAEIGALKSLDEIDAVGHRIVQGGDKFNESCIVTPEVEAGIDELCDLAPVHNAGHLRGIRAVNALMPDVPQVTVFDNAFHSTMPAHAYLYAVPYEFYEKYHVRLSDRQSRHQQRRKRHGGGLCLSAEEGIFAGCLFLCGGDLSGDKAARRLHEGL